MDLMTAKLWAYLRKAKARWRSIGRCMAENEM